MEEKQYKEIELRSEEVQEVMNNISPWVVRCGITVLFIIIVIVLLGCWLFKYPDTLSAEVTLTTDEPPAFVLARATGKIDTFYVHNNDSVGINRRLGVILNSASSTDVLWLIDRMEEWKVAGYDWKIGMDYFASKRLQLGEIQASYTNFFTSLIDYARFIELGYYPKKLLAGEKLLTGQRMYLNLAKREYALTEKEMKLIQSMYDRDSILYKNNAMIVTEFEESGSRYLQNLRSKETSKISVLQAEMQLGQQEESMLDVRKQAYNEEQNRRIGLKNTIDQLNAQLCAWEQNYLLKSPVNGKVTFMNVWARNQNIQSGETVCVVLPSDSSEVVGKALLPLQGSGKVHVGQKVHIRLNNYPDQEFGYIKGMVQSISPAPTDKDVYVVEIELPEGLRTNYGNLLSATRELKGSADIILANRNVLERLLAPLRKVVEYEE